MMACKICKSTTTKIVDSKKDRLYHRCSVCDYISLDDKFYLDKSLEKKHYDNHHNNLQSLGYVEMFERLISEYIAPYRSKIDKALDFGCGEGEVLPILLQRDGICCDRYDYFYFPKKVYEGSSYDLIVSTEVFEHLSNPMEVFTELVSHLNKDGYLLLMSSFHPSNEELFLKWFYIKDVTHIGFFSMKTFNYIAKRLNLKILRDNSKNIVMFSKTN